MSKRYEFNGGTSDPCIISWPSGMTSKGEIREQCHHALDLVPTVLDALGVEAPDTIKGHTQSHFDGVSMRYSFDDQAAPGARQTQFFSMLGSRGIWYDGWKSVTMSTSPTTPRCPRPQAVVVRGRSFVIGVLVDLPEPGAQGVLFAQGSRFGGYALYVKDNRLHDVNSLVGMFDQIVVGTRTCRGHEPDPVGLLREGGRGPGPGDRWPPLPLPRRHEGGRGLRQDPARRLHDRGRGAWRSAAMSATR